MKDMWDNLHSGFLKIVLTLMLLHKKGWQVDLDGYLGAFYRNTVISEDIFPRFA